MAVTADVVKVVLEGEVDGYNADIKSSVGVFEGSMTKMERAAVRTEKTVSASMTRTARLTGRQALTIQQTVNDVIASVSSGGANPLTILAQQGGQVTEAFGGLGGTLKALAPYAFSAGGALTGMGLALGAAVIAADRLDASNKEITNSLTGLGRGAGLTIDQFKALADANNEAGNVSRSAAEDMARSYINTGKIGSDVIGGLIAVTDDYSRATGVDAKKATELLGAAFADPVKGAELLQQQFGFLDAKTMTLIQTMVAAGDTMGAQKLLSDRLGDALKGQADNVSFLTKVWRGLKGAISDAATAARDFATAQPGAANGRTGGAAGAAARAAARQAEAQGVAAGVAKNKRGTEAQGLIDEALGDDRRRAIRGEIQKIEKAVKDGSVDASKASAAIKTLKEDMAKIGAGPSGRSARAGRQPTQAETREAVRNAEIASTKTSAGFGAGVQSIDVQTIRDLEKLFISRGGLEEYIRNGGGDFQAAGGPALEQASDSLRRYQEETYDSTYNSIRGGLEAAFQDGVPGVAEYFGNELKRALLDDVAKTLASLIRGRDAAPGDAGGGIGEALLSRGKKLFGRASGGNMVAGVPYQINEGRPEVFVPPMSGQMVPVGRLGRGGGQVVQNSYNLQGAVLTNEIWAEIKASEARTTGRAYGFSQRAKADALRAAPGAVAKNRSRRG